MTKKIPGQEFFSETMDKAARSVLLDANIHKLIMSFVQGTKFYNLGWKSIFFFRYNCAIREKEKKGIKMKDAEDIIRLGSYFNQFSLIEKYQDEYVQVIENLQKNPQALLYSQYNEITVSDCACKFGNVKFFDWINQKNIPIGIEDAILFASTYGHINILEYIYQNQINVRKEADESILPMERKIRYGGQNALVGSTYRAENPYIRAIYNNHFDVLKWLIEHPLTKISFSTNFMEYTTDQLLMHSAAHNSLEMTMWLKENCPSSYCSDALDVAASFGHLDIVKYLFENRAESCSYAFTRSLTNSRENVAKFLIQNVSKNVRDKMVAQLRKAKPTPTLTSLLAWVDLTSHQPGK
jgi:hypothetical protein